MGYSTSFDLHWKATDAWKAKPLCGHKREPGKKFCADCGKPAIDVALDDVVGDYIEANENMSYALRRDGKGSDSCKWYEHQEDLAAMSKAIPGVLFHLEGEGEESGDIWDAFALDGKVEKHEAQIVRVTEPSRALLKGSVSHGE